MKLANAVADLRAAVHARTDPTAAFEAVVDAGHNASFDTLNTAIDTLLADLATADPEQIAQLAIASGALVERGGSPLRGLDLLLDAVTRGARVLADAPDLDADAIDRATPPVGLPPAAEAWVHAFQRVVVGTMARLARSVEARQRARAHADFARAVRALHEATAAWHAFFLCEVLDMLDDAPVFLVETDTGKVTRLRVTGIRNCFHLITLLEGHDPFELADRGESAVSTSRGYYTWRYLTITSDRAIDIVQTMIPGDLRALDLPQFEGTRVVVRTPTGVHRSWDLNFVSPIHDALQSSVVTDAELPEADARTLRERMATGS